MRGPADPASAVRDSAPAGARGGPEEVLGVRTEVGWLPSPSLIVVLGPTLIPPPDEVTVTSACAVIRDSAGQVLLTYVRARGYDLPGGHVDPGETPEQACRREITEETGLRLPDDVALTRRAAMHIEMAAAAPAGYRYPWPRSQMWIYSARLAGPRPAVAPSAGSECDHAVWVEADEVARRCGGRTWFPALAVT